MSGGATDVELSHKILDACGSFFGDKYVLLNNEFYDEYNPYFKVSYLFDSAFNKEDSSDVFLRGAKQEEGINSVDVDEVAEELGIKLKEKE